MPCVKVHQDFNIRTVLVQLHHKFTAGTAGRSHTTILHNCHDLFDLTLAICDHIGDGITLGTHTQCTGGINADTNVNVSRFR